MSEILDTARIYLRKRPFQGHCLFSKFWLFWPEGLRNHSRFWRPTTVAQLSAKSSHTPSSGLFPTYLSWHSEGLFITLSVHSEDVGDWPSLALLWCGWLACPGGSFLPWGQLLDKSLLCLVSEERTNLCSLKLTGLGPKCWSAEDLKPLHPWPSSC